jgi:xanthine dehydrogenase accessory factor
MIPAELSRRSQELAAARAPFVTATVVRAQSPTSVEPGSMALVLGDGTIEGFVGGTCAEQSVRAYSLAALASGEPVLLRILPDGDVDAGVDPEAKADGTEIARDEGSVTVRNPCLSGGAIEVFLEPAPPAPRVLVVGETPIAAAVGRIGEELGLEIVAVTEEGPDPAGDELAVVVAAHGRDELRSLRRGLESGVPYVGLVASGKRGAGVLDDLRAEGVAEELLERIDVPAGIPIGSRTAGEIALSILAKVVEVRHAGAASATVRSRAGATEPARRPLAVDPICGMTVAAATSSPSLERDGETFYFCSEGCKAEFEAREEHAPIAG